MNRESSMVESLDRLKIEEEQAIKNKVNKTTRKLKWQKTREHEIQAIGGNVNIITQDLVDKFIGKPSVSNPTDISDNEINFPALGYSNRVIKRGVGNVSCVNNFASSSDKQVLSLGDFIVAKSEGISISKKENTVIETRYAGNSLDSDAPVRKRGKHREKPKQKKGSALKRGINLDIELIEDKEIHNVYLKDIFPEIVISEEVDKKATIFISRMVELQEKLYKRDSLKGKYKRRYVVGFHETKKYLNINKAKLIIIATDLKFVKANDAMSSAVREIMELCKKNEVLYLFTLKRRRIGILTLKNIPVSCMAILNYEGAEEQLNSMILSTTCNTEEGELNSKIIPEDKKDEYTLQEIC